MDYKYMWEHLKVMLSVLGKGTKEYETVLEVMDNLEKTSKRIKTFKET